MNGPQCTLRSPLTQPLGEAGRRSRVLKLDPPLCLFELRVPLDKFFRAASRKAHGEAAVFVVALNANDRSNAKARMTNLSPQPRICSATARCSGTPDAILTRLAPGACLCLLWTSAPATR